MIDISEPVLEILRRIDFDPGTVRSLEIFPYSVTVTAWAMPPIKDGEPDTWTWTVPCSVRPKAVA